MSHTGVAIIGLGAVGRQAARTLLARDRRSVTAAVDNDPALAGRDLGDLLGVGPLDIPISDDLTAAAGSRTALVATTSVLAELEPIVTTLAANGVHVVSICEELGFPWRAQPELSRRIDQVARAHGIVVLGTGANPGMLMDVVPTVLSSLVPTVDGVVVRRTAEMADYGGILHKFGFGLTPEEFAAEVAAGKLPGHFGFAESIGALSWALGLELDSIEVGLPEIAVVAERERVGPHARLGAGTVAGIRHGARGSYRDNVIVELSIHFGFRPDLDAVELGDRWTLRTPDGDIRVGAPAGFASAPATVAVACNVVDEAATLEPGLRTMLDLPARSLAAKGRNRIPMTGR
ncbi:dihydrodipicolinate reductase [Nocardia fluminea]|uniref:dihydrodipicolinate reductase n=1 Tax=Nocardia fluminea TaxID=134984 RepID=UPI00341B0CA8